MGKNPAFQFYPSDWSRDLEEHPLEIEGAWIRICCKLWWSETRGKLTRTNEQWAKILRVYPDDAERILNYINSYKIGDVLPDSNKNLTVISRRMLRDEKDRQNNCLRQKRHYQKQKPNGDITADSQDSSSSSSFLKKERIKKSPSLSDEEWLKSLEDNPIYDGIEVRVLYGKLLVWCENKKKKPTRTRFINWLNREERPLQAKTGRMVAGKKKSLRPCDVPDADTEAARILGGAG